MRGIILLTLACAATSFAQTDPTAIIKARHDFEDQHWARWNGQPKSAIRDMRIAAGISDTTDGVHIIHLDATTLNKPRYHVLLVEMGGGHCMRVHVLKRDGDSFKEIWLLDKMPRYSWTREDTSNRPGPGICAQGPRPPNARATSEGRIIVEIPVLSDPGQMSIPAATYTFVWDYDSRYRLLDEFSR